MKRIKPDKETIAWALLIIAAAASFAVLVLMLSGCTVAMKHPTYVVKKAEHMNNGITLYFAHDITPNNGFNGFAFCDTVKFCVGDTVKVTRGGQLP